MTDGDDMRDPVAELCRILEEAGARVTMDPARSISLPCVICGEKEKPRDLVRIGTYTRRMGGNIQPGDAIVRPMCARCVELTTDVT